MNMKRTYIINTIALLLSLAWCFSACSDDDNEESGLRIVKSDVSFDANGGTGSITFVAGGTVSAHSDKDWLTMAVPASGTVSFTVDENLDILGRTATVTITQNGKSEVMAITQLGAILDPVRKYTISALNKTTLFDLYANTSNVTVSAADSWVDISVVNGQLVVTPELNTGQERSTILTFNAGWKTTTSVLTQQSFVDVSRVWLDVYGNAISFTVHDDINELATDWAAQPGDTWMHVAQNGQTVTVTADENTTGSFRASNVIIQAGGVTITVPARESGVYNFYNYFLGTWKLLYNDGDSEVNVILTENVANASYTMTGLYQPVTISFDNTTKKMKIVAHNTGRYASLFYTFFRPCDMASGGRIIANLTVGFDLEFNYDELDNSIKISDNGIWGSNIADTFLFYVHLSNSITATTLGTAASYPYVVRMYR